MKPKKIKPIKRLLGEIMVPGDKSISHRAVMIGAIANGETKVKGLLDCDDCSYTIKAFKDMGISIRKDGDHTVICGKGLKGLKKPNGPIYAGESGTTIRLLAGILAGQGFEATLEGDDSLSKRPMKRIVEPLSLMGVEIKAKDGKYPPVKIKGGSVNPIDYALPVASAQVKSSVLFAGLYADGITNLEESSKSRDHTERMLKYFGAKLAIEGLKISLEGGKELSGRSFEIPGDISAASFFLVGASLLKGSKVKINKVSVNPARAGILDILSRMGVNIKILNRVDSFEPYADIEVVGSYTKGIVIDEDVIPGVIDELPIIFVLAALSKGDTVIKGAGELRVKETDRINSMRANLEKMGARIQIIENNIIIEGVGELKGADLKSFGDHRTCMAMTVAALCAKGESTIDDAACVGKSFPEFFNVLSKLEG